jgi:thiamine-phosphate pyrophosphorylase
VERRILDANLNRAREAARVLEDIARFRLDRADLTRRAKMLRHSIARAGGVMDQLALAAWRNTPADVGTKITTRFEGERPDCHALATANGARLCEALRVLEEAAKVLGDPAASARFKKARYVAYSLERDLILALGSPRRRQWRLCVIVTESLCRIPWCDVARAAFEAGAEAVQLREKGLPDSAVLARATELVRIARKYRGTAIINDRPDIALLAGADGVHVGRTDMPVPAARRIVGGLLIGASCESVRDAVGALRAGADYLGLGAMFPTNTKTKETIAGPGLVRRVIRHRQLARVPHLVIGGITPDNIHAVVEAGACGVAVSACVCTAPNPERVCRRLLRAFGG